MLNDSKIRKLKPSEKCTPLCPDKYSDQQWSYENRLAAINKEIIMPQIPHMLCFKKVENYIRLRGFKIYDQLDKRSKRYDPIFPI